MASGRIVALILIVIALAVFASKQSCAPSPGELELVRPIGADRAFLIRRADGDRSRVFLALHDRKRGALWSLLVPRPEPPTDVIPVQRGILLANPDRPETTLTMLHEANGTMVWRRKIPGSPPPRPWFRYHDGTVYIRSSMESEYDIFAIDRKTGHTRWQFSEGLSWSHSASQRVGEHLIIRKHEDDETTLEILRLADGRSVLSRPLPYWREFCVVGNDVWYSHNDTLYRLHLPSLQVATIDLGLATPAVRSIQVTALCGQRSNHHILIVRSSKAPHEVATILAVDLHTNRLAWQLLIGPHQLWTPDDLAYRSSSTPMARPSFSGQLQRFVPLLRMIDPGNLKLRLDIVDLDTQHIAHSIILPDLYRHTWLHRSGNTSVLRYGKLLLSFDGDHAQPQAAVRSDAHWALPAGVNETLLWSQDRAGLVLDMTTLKPDPHDDRVVPVTPPVLPAEGKFPEID